MSSNKTIIPGMEDAYSPTSPGWAGQNVPGGTRIPEPFGTKSGKVISQKPIVGFLYSISRTPAGEYWPLHIGTNSIGRSQDCEICLGEATVSGRHADLVVRQMKNPEKMIASICDASSTCGTMINGESLGFDQRECFNGDIITIGEHYDLYLILIDAKQIGLNICKDFMPAQKPYDSTRSLRSQGNPVVEGETHGNPYAAPTGSGIKRTKGYDENEANEFMSGGTVGMDEGTPDSQSQSPTQPGRTIFM